MAIAHRNTQTNSGSSTSITVTKPTGTVSGDVLIAFIATARTGVTVGVTGFTAIGTQTSFSHGETQAFYKVAGGSEPATYTFTSSLTSKIVGSVTAYSGANGTPIDTSTVTTTASLTGTGQTANAVTATYTNDMLVCGFTFGNDQNTSYSYTADSPLTERGDVSLASATPSSITLMVAEELRTVSGTTGTKTAQRSVSGTTGSSATHSVLVIDASPASPATAVMAMMP